MPSKYEDAFNSEAIAQNNVKFETKISSWTKNLNSYYFYNDVLLTKNVTVKSSQIGLFLNGYGVYGGQLTMQKDSEIVSDTASLNKTLLTAAEGCHIQCTIYTFVADPDHPEIYNSDDQQYYGSWKNSEGVEYTKSYKTNYLFPLQITTIYVYTAVAD